MRIEKIKNKNIVFTNCSICNKEFIYKYGLSSCKRSKNHFCSEECLSHIRKKHGMTISDERDRKKYYMYRKSLHRAKEKNIFHDLKLEELPDIPEFCPVLGIKIVLDNNITCDNSPSLDRIIPKLGYTKGNVRFISIRANKLKSDGLSHEFLKIYEDALKIENNK